MTEGTVLFHENFSFHDGGVSDKLLIILNTPSAGEPYVCCKTTKHCKWGIKTEGCHSQKNIYMIKADFDWFNLDTWIPLDELYPLTAKSVLKACLQDKACKIVHELKPNTIKAIKNCIKKTIDISPINLKLLFK